MLYKVIITKMVVSYVYIYNFIYFHYVYIYF